MACTVTKWSAEKFRQCHILVAPPRDYSRLPLNHCCSAPRAKTTKKNAQIQKATRTQLPKNLLSGEPVRFRSVRSHAKIPRNSRARSKVMMAAGNKLILLSADLKTRC